MEIYIILNSFIPKILQARNHNFFLKDNKKIHFYVINFLNFIKNYVNKFAIKIIFS